MKTLLTISTLVFTLMFSSTSFAKWTEVVGDTSGNTFYLDFERIRKHGGYVYFWLLMDYLKPNEFGNLSHQEYSQNDCQLFRSQSLSFVFHKQPMGRGDGVPHTVESPEWDYAVPNSVSEVLIKEVCRFTE